MRFYLSTQRWEIRVIKVVRYSYSYERPIYLHKNALGWPLVAVFVYKPLRAHVHLLVKKARDWPNLNGDQREQGCSLVRT